jgi:GT2 family glycosyltransferase
MSESQARRQRASTLVVVINWNGDQDLIDCLNSLQAAKTGLSQTYDVLVLDNDSTTGAFSRLKVEFPWVERLPLSDNRYWAGGNNAAVQWALERDYEWIVLSNSDIVVGKFWYPALQAAGRSEEIGAVGFNIFGEARRVPIAEFHECNASFDLRDLSWHDDIHMSGCFLAVRASCFASLGGFDEAYKMYAEEHDFLTRVRLAGWRTVRCNAPIYHVSELASRKVPLLTSYFAIRNNMRVLIKLGPHRLWAPARYAIRVLRYMLDPSKTVNLVDSCRRREKPTDHLLTNLNIWLRACLWNIIHLPATLVAGHRDIKAAHSVRAMRTP